MPRSDHYALLVAINDYPGLSNLAGPENDANAFAQWLKDPAGGDVDEKNVRLVRSSDFASAEEAYDANPTEEQVKRVLNGWLRGPEGWKDRVGERLYLFFAGHGFTAGSTIADPALYTAVAQNYDPAHIAAYRYASKIANAGFFDEIVLVMDCCQDVLKATSLQEPTWSPPDRNRSSKVKLLQAYGAPRGKKAFERSLANGEPVRGLFSSVWLEAMQTAQPDAEGKVTGAAVKSRLNALWAERYRAECDYDPPVRLPDGDDICLLRKKARGMPAAAPPVECAIDPLPVPDAQFSSAAPILGTRTSHEYQHYPAVELAYVAPTVVEARADSQLILFLRDSAHRNGQPMPGAAPWDALSLDSLDRDESLSLSGLLRVTHDSGHASIKLAVVAGRYAIGAHVSTEDADFVVSFPVMLVPGWRTEVYVDCIDPNTSDDRPLDRVLDFANAAVFIVPVNADCPLKSGVGLRTERARKQFSSGQLVIVGEADETLRRQIAESPMLGLYAACGTAACRDADLARMEQLLDMLPPDVRSVSADAAVLTHWCWQARGFNKPLDIGVVRGLPFFASTWALALQLQDGIGLERRLHTAVGQWRLASSMWGCWRQPADAAREMRRELWSPADEIRFSRSDADSAGTTVGEVPGPSYVAKSWSPDALDWERVAAGLRHPVPAHSPFQQALRRRVLDLLADNDAEWPPAMVATLGRQFGLDDVTALLAAKELYRAAAAGAETLLRANPPPRRLTAG